MHYAEILRWTVIAALAAIVPNWPRCGVGFWALPAGRLFVVARVQQGNADRFRAADCA